MKIVIDTNVFMAGLLKSSIVREILVSENLRFYLPEQALKEIKKYENELCEKSGYTKEEFDLLLMLLLESIILIQTEKIKEHMEEAERIMSEIDVKDSSFIALAMYIGADGIWSFDKHFQKQEKIRIFNTRDIIEFLRSKDVS